jgi:hypothetical protein
MKIIKKTPYENGMYPVIQTWDRQTLPEGYAEVPDTLDTTVFYDYNGFVILTIEDDVVTKMVANPEARDIDAKKTKEWQESQPKPVPSPQEDMDAMLVDHEYRLTMLELFSIPIE